MNRRSTHFIKLTLSFLAMTGFFLSSGVIAQTSHAVAVTSNIFTPKNITINVGDTVVWICTDGRHNVNGTQSSYPNNPESFGNSTGRDWTYSYVFTQPGMHDYQCDPHVGLGMIGTVNVLETSGVEEFKLLSVRVYPNPVSDQLHLEFSQAISGQLIISLLDITGQELLNKVLDENSSSEVIDMSQISPGIYFLSIFDQGKRKVHKLIKN